MAVLALDLGTKTGFAVHHDDETLSSGVWNLAVTAACPDRTRELRLWRQLMATHERCGITTVAYERVDSHGRPDEKKIECPNCKSKFDARVSGFNTMAAHVYGALKGQVEMWADVHRLPPPPTVAVMTLKKFATGSGRAKKPDMIKWAQMRWPEQHVKDDNQADALHVLDWVLIEVLKQRKKAVIDLRGVR